jgi:hypothetical protein
MEEKRGKTTTYVPNPVGIRSGVADFSYSRKPQLGETHEKESIRPSQNGSPLG